MATIKHARTLALQATSPRINPVPLPSNVTVGTGNLTDGSVTNTKIGGGAVWTGNLTDGAITAAKLADGSVTNIKIGAAAVDTINIVSAAITTAKIGTAAVVTANIADAAITNAKIGALAVDAAKIADATITTAKIADAQITSAKIASATITDANIASLNASKINAGTISANYINGGTFSGASIQIASSESGWLLNAGYAGTVVYYRKLEGYNINAGNGAMPGYSAVIGTSVTAAAGVYGSSTGSGGHGLRGEAGNGLGFVGYNGGTYDFYAYGSASNYGPFTGAHDALVPKGAALEPGDIVVDAGVAVRKNVSNTICHVALSSMPSQPGAVGVVCNLPRSIEIVSELPAAMMDRLWTTQPDGQRVENTIPAPEWYDLRLTHAAITINALGEGQVNVCGLGGALAIGDLITTSPMPGKGQRQSDDVVRASSVAKCREAVTFDFPEQVKTVACIYLCG